MTAASGKILNIEKWILTEVLGLQSEVRGSEHLWTQVQRKNSMNFTGFFSAAEYNLIQKFPRHSIPGFLPMLLNFLRWFSFNCVSKHPENTLKLKKKCPCKGDFRRATSFITRAVTKSQETQIISIFYPKSSFFNIMTWWIKSLIILRWIHLSGCTSFKMCMSHLS